MRKRYRRQLYMLTLLLVTGASMVGGWLFSSSLSSPDYAQSDAPSSKQLLDSYFEQGLAAMLDKQYLQAAEHWRKLLLINDNIAEAHVNLGFSLFELEQPGQAAQHFNRALDINAYQANAYYGLAISLEQLGDLGGALGAMRSYLHLAHEDEPHLRKARSAVWEWEAELNRQRSEANASPAANPPEPGSGEPSMAN